MFARLAALVLTALALACAAPVDSDAQEIVSAGDQQLQVEIVPASGERLCLVSKVVVLDGEGGHHIAPPRACTEFVATGPAPLQVSIAPVSVEYVLTATAPTLQ